MNYERRTAYVLVHGEEAWREKQRVEKQIERVKMQMAGLTTTGRPRPGPPSIFHGGIAHPLDCPCFDCTYGEVASLKAAATRSPDWYLYADQRPARTGRFQARDMAGRGME